MEQRVQKIISASGFCSRRKAEEFIAAGRVTVNGSKIKLGDKATAQDIILVGKVRITIPDHLYLMFNKPSGYITTKSDPYQRKSIMQLLQGISRSVYPVGRLDRDARGLLLLTSDGDFAQKILHPSNKITKTYQVSLDKPLSKEELTRIRSGIYVEKRRVKADIKTIKPKLVEITIHEGRNKIVKKIFNKVDHYVKDLKRVGIGRLRLSVAEGKYKALSEADKEKLIGRVKKKTNTAAKKVNNLKKHLHK